MNIEECKCHLLNNRYCLLFSKQESLLLHLRLKSGLIVNAHQHVLEGTPYGVVLSLAEILFVLISEHPVLKHL